MVYWNRTSMLKPSYCVQNGLGQAMGAWQIQSVKSANKASHIQTWELVYATKVVKKLCYCQLCITNGHVGACLREAMIPLYLDWPDKQAGRRGVAR